MSKSLAVLSVVVCLFASSASGAIHVWTGAASGQFSDSANWSGGSPAGDPNADLSFPAGARLAVNNDLTGLTVRSIAFSGSGYTIAGNTLTITTGAEITDATPGPNEISCNLILTSETTVTILGSLFSPSAELILSGSIGGSGGFRMNGGGYLTFAGGTANTYSGTTRILYGILQLKKPARTTAIAGELRIEQTNANYEYGALQIFTDEQIADTAPVTFGYSANIGVGGVETFGPMTLYRGARIDTYSVWVGSNRLNGKIVLGGGVRVIGSLSDAWISGDVYLAGSRTISLSGDSGGTRLWDFAGAPGAGLTFTADPPVTESVLPFSDLRATYSGPTVIQGGSVAVADPQTDATVHGGMLGGTVKSLTADGGTIGGRYGSVLVSAGDIRLTSGATVSIDVGPDPAPIRLNGTLVLGSAHLAFTGQYPGRQLGKTYTIISNASATPVNGTFSGLPEGSVIDDRWRISYAGGDGNDVTLTETGHLSSNLSLTVPSSGTVGSTVNLRAQVTTSSAVPLTPTGSVTFAIGANVLATVPLSSGVAVTDVYLPLGFHTLTATYAGDAAVLPSQATTYVTIYHVTPTLTSVEPLTVMGGTTTRLTLRGTNFVDGSTGLIYFGTGYPTTYVSPTELQVDFAAPDFFADTQVSVQVKQPGLGNVVSEAITMLVTAAPPPPPPPQTPLIFAEKSVSAPVAPGATSAWLALTRRDFGGGLQYRRGLIPDSDNDGLTSWNDPENIPFRGIWTVTDLTTRTVMAGKPDHSAPVPAPFPEKVFLRNPAGQYSHLILPSTSGFFILWGRPGTGGWTISVGDGGVTDGDHSQNGFIVFEASAFTPLGASPAPPTGFAPGDVFVAIRGVYEDWFGQVVDDHLAETTGPGVMSFATTIGYVPGTPESAGVVHLTLLRREGTDGVATVKYTTVDDTAIAGTHYVAQAGTVRFEAGEILKTIDIPLINDSIYSGSTFFSVVLSDPAGATLVSPTSAQVNIIEDDAPPAFSFQTANSVQEGDSGTVEVPVTIKLQGLSRKPATVSWGWTEQNGNSHGDTLTFAPGETQKTVVMTYTGNRKPEPDRWLSVWLWTPVDATAPTGSTTVSIVDDDFASVSIADASVAESALIANVTLTASENSWKALKVHYELRNGSAVAGSDYTSVVTGTVTFDLTSTRKTFAIPITDDSLAEGPEYFTVVITSVENGLVGRATGTISIVDDDAPSSTIPTALNAAANGKTSISVTWLPAANAASYEVYRSSGGSPYSLVKSGTSTAFTDTLVAPDTVYLYKVRSLATDGSGSLFSGVDVASTIVFADDPLVAGVTVVKGAHIHELQVAAQAIRWAAGLGTFLFDNTSPSGTLIRAADMAQLRTALNEARTVIGLPALTFTDPVLTSGTSMIKAAHIQELRAGFR